MVIKFSYCYMYQAIYLVERNVVFPNKSFVLIFIFLSVFLSSRFLQLQFPSPTRLPPHILFQPNMANFLLSRIRWCNRTTLCHSIEATALASLAYACSIRSFPCPYGQTWRNVYLYSPIRLPYLSLADASYASSQVCGVCGIRTALLLLRMAILPGIG